MVEMFQFMQCKKRTENVFKMPKCHSLSGNQGQGSECWCHNFCCNSQI